MDVVTEINHILQQANVPISILSMDHLIHSLSLIMTKLYEALFESKLEKIVSEPKNTIEEFRNIELVLVALQSYNGTQISAESLISGNMDSLTNLVKLFHLALQSVPRKSLENQPIESTNVTDLGQILEEVNLLEEKLRNEISNTEEYFQHQSDALQLKKAEIDKLITLRNDQPHFHPPLLSPCKIIPHPERRKRKMKLKKKNENQLRENQEKIPIQVSPEHKVPSRPNSSVPSKRKCQIRKNVLITKSPVSNQRPLSAPTQENSPKSSNQDSFHNKELSQSGNFETVRRKSKDRIHSEVEYTYNKWTGRKVRKQEYEEFLAQRQEMMASLISPPQGTQQISNNTKPIISKRTERTIENYVNKMKLILDPPAPDEYKHLNQPRELSIYSSLVNYDLLLSVEHCHQCETHPMTLRHRSQEYILHADSILRSVASFIHSKYPCVRLGVIRFPINTLCSKKYQNEEGNRYGACEVQIAYRSPTGVLCYELLHSKLKTMKWPSISHLQSKIENFFGRYKVEIVEHPHYFCYESTSSEGVGNYPIGVGQWEEVPLSQPLWKYRWDFDYAQSIDAVQWVFDSKSFAHNPKFNNGAQVRAHFVPNKWGGRERYSILSTVISSYKNTSGNLNMVRIQPCYPIGTDSIIDILEENCVSLSDHDEYSPPETVDRSKEFQIPENLFLLLYCGLENGFIESNEESDDEYENIFEDSPNSDDQYRNLRLLHSQLFRLAWKSIKTKSGKEVGTMQHPFHWNLDVDVQSCYSDVMLKWILNFFKNASGTVTISHLKKWMQSSPKYQYLKDLQQKKERRKPFIPCKEVLKETIFRLDLTSPQPNEIVDDPLSHILFGDVETIENDY